MRVKWSGVWASFNPSLQILWSMIPPAWLLKWSAHAFDYIGFNFYLTGPSGVWKYRSMSMHPEMEVFPVTWTKLTLCPCQIFMGVSISASDFSEIRVMLDPELMITFVWFWLRKFTVAGTWVAWEPRKEHPGGLARCFFFKFYKWLQIRRVLGNEVMDLCNISCKLSSSILV